eukprot:m.117134 g.117134  ORF g.117134 m.117134 type:complete len:1509 (+) comp13624_c0_seq3:124-4650(+)
MSARPGRRRKLPSMPPSTASSPRSVPVTPRSTSRAPRTPNSLATSPASVRVPALGITPPPPPQFSFDETDDGASPAQSMLGSTSSSSPPSGANITAAPSSTAASSLYSSTQDDASTDNQNVIVSVRVRPFLQREIDLGSKLVVSMQGKSTMLQHDAKGKVHTFTYDHSFWSHNPRDRLFCTQEHVYQRMGRPLLDRCLEGYNCCLFAYGQTGSGKSFSMMGTPGTGVTVEGGVIPRFTSELFERIQQQASDKSAVKVELSYFEIYSERVYDLLATPTKGGRMRPLRVREHPSMGPYVDGLTTYAALSYKDVEAWLNVGSQHRATASTNMNATSSRSHAVFTMVVTMGQIGEDGEEHAKVSKVNLVDLAGSERSDSAGTVGIRLREGAAINKSLHTLGKVISLLAAKAAADPRKQVFIPYRDSVLTWILKESLGGNSRTAMLATISPSEANVDETLSTLRYADQARRIVNAATVNEDPNQRLIADLRAEIEQLRSQVGGQGNMREVSMLREKLTQTQSLMQQMNRTWEQKLAEAHAMREKNERLLRSQSVATTEQTSALPTLVNLNEDPQLSHLLVHVLSEGKTVMGQSDEADVTLGGVMVLPKHCAFECEKAAEGIYTVSLTPFDDALVFVNGEDIEPNTTVMLEHSSRIILGNHHFFRLNIPKAPGIAQDGAMEGKGYEFAKSEFDRVQQQKLESQLEFHKQSLVSEITAQHEQERLALERELQEKLRQQQEEYEAQVQALQERMETNERERASLQQQGQEKAKELQEAEHEARLALEAAREQLEQEKKNLLSQKEAEAALERERLQSEAQSHLHTIEELTREKEETERAVSALRSENERFKASIPSVGLDASASLTQFAAQPRELLQISQSLKESNKIAADLKQGTMMTLAASETGEPMIRVVNTNLKVETQWTMAEYEQKRQQMQEAYDRFQTSSSDVDDQDLDVSAVFFDPSDNWKSEVLIGGSVTPSPRHKRPVSYTAGMSQDFSFNLDTISTPASSARDKLVGRHSEVRRRQKPPGKDTVDAFVAEPAVSALCCKYIKNAIDSTANSRSAHDTSVDEIMSCVSALKVAVNSLNESFAKYNSQDNLIKLRDMGITRNASISITVSLQLLGALVRGLRATASSPSFLNTVQRLSQSTSSLSNHAMKLLQGIENEIESMVQSGHRDCLNDIISVSALCGELAMALASEEQADPDHEAAAYSQDSEFIMSSRMVDMPAVNQRRSSAYLDPDPEEMPTSASVQVDDEVLFAFHQGATQQVSSSLAECREALEAKTQLSRDLQQQLTPRSNLNRDILGEFVRVVDDVKALLLASTALQEKISLRAEGDALETAQNIFYHKQYSDTIGIVGEVQQVTDALSWLGESLSMAVAGQEGPEEILSNSHGLRSAVSHLLAASDTKIMRYQSDLGHVRPGHLKQLADGTFSSTAALNRLCQAYAASQTRTNGLSPEKLMGMSAVARRAQLIDLQTANIKLEQELDAGRRQYQMLMQAEYTNSKPVQRTANTSAI